MDFFYYDWSHYLHHYALVNKILLQPSSSKLAVATGSRSLLIQTFWQNTHHSGFVEFVCWAAKQPISFYFIMRTPQYM